MQFISLMKRRAKFHITVQEFPQASEIFQISQRFRHFVYWRHENTSERYTESYLMNICGS